MGVAIDMCICSTLQAITPNSKLNVESDGMNLYNLNNNNNKNDDNNNNLEQIKKRKKNSNGVIINNEQSNDAEKFNNNIPSNGHVILTPKQKES